MFCFQVSAGLLRPIGIPLRLDDAGRGEQSPAVTFPHPITTQLPNYHPNTNQSPLFPMAVVTECCAMGKVYTTRRKRGGDGGSHGRGGAAQWASQWWAAANDAAEVSVKQCSHPSTPWIHVQLPNYHPNANQSPPN